MADVSLEDIKQDLGCETAIKLFKHYGGMNVYISAKLKGAVRIMLEDGKTDAEISRELSVNPRKLEKIKFELEAKEK